MSTGLIVVGLAIASFVGLVGLLTFWDNRRLDPQMRHISEALGLQWRRGSIFNPASAGGSIENYKVALQAHSAKHRDRIRIKIGSVHIPHDLVIAKRHDLAIPVPLIPSPKGAPPLLSAQHDWQYEVYGESEAAHGFARAAVTDAMLTITNPGAVVWVADGALHAEQTIPKAWSADLIVDLIRSLVHIVDTAVPAQSPYRGAAMPTS